MKSLEESIAKAMDSDNTDILPYLPYILQDFWEIGSSPEDMIELIKKHQKNLNDLYIADLGCGKGAVSVNISKQLGCRCLGIDGIHEFIDEAKMKAEEYGVSSLCEFKAGDIRTEIEHMPKFDVIILGAIGQVFGNYYETLTVLKPHLNSTGIIIIDDAYIEEEGIKHPNVLPINELLKQVNDAEMRLIDEIKVKDEISQSQEYNQQYDFITQRCKELMQKHPDKTGLFEAYIQKQNNEYTMLTTALICSTMVMKPNPDQN